MAALAYKVRCFRVGRRAIVCTANPKHSFLSFHLEASLARDRKAHSIVPSRDRPAGFGTNLTDHKPSAGSAGCPDAVVKPTS
jgi:hypothetical protein